MIKFFKDIFEYVNKVRINLIQEEERRVLLQLILGNLCILEMFGSTTDLNILLFTAGAILFVIQPLIFIYKRSRGNISIYIKTSIISLIIILSLYLLGIKSEQYFPILGNLLSYLILLLDLVIVYIITPPKQKDFISQDKKDLKNWTVAILLMILIGLSAYNNFNKLGDKVFHQDERYSLKAAKGFSETGEYMIWDFFLDKATTESYTRNSLFTQLLSFSGEKLGFNEFSMRLPVAIAGVIGVILTFFVINKITKKKYFGLIGAFFWAFNDVVIYFSRFSRGYIFLMLFSEIILYLCWEIYNTKNLKKEIILWISFFLIFILSYTFHQSILLLTPLPLLIFITKHFDILKKNLRLLLSISPVILAIVIFLIYQFKLYNHFGICLHCSPNTIYIRHLLEPYNLIASASFLYITFHIVSRNFLSHSFKNLTMLGLYISIFIAIFLFNRYEDFRYVAVLQPCMILCFIYIIEYASHYLFKYRRLYTLFLILIPFILMKVQIPNITADTLMTQKAQADWNSTDGDRIHRRTAIPESREAFNYIFSESTKDDDIVIVRLLDGGIGWVDDYYLEEYLAKFNSSYKEFYLYTEEPSEDELFVSNYSKFRGKYYINNSRERESIKNIILSFPQLLEEHKKIYFIANIGNLANELVMEYIDNNCTNISEKIGISKYIYLGNDLNKRYPYFPNIYLCE